MIFQEGWTDIPSSAPWFVGSGAVAVAADHPSSSLMFLGTLLIAWVMTEWHARQLPARV